ncbi:MAG TPA: hypothetical protein VKE51_27640 [Vicinamibacterales bacterium]|nr:hypothetical protein [Vicinamibacterales bacterium]
MESNTGSTLLALSIAGLLTLGSARVVRAESGCSNESLRGSYAIQGSGTVMSGPFAGPAAFVGILRFDGAGNLEGNFIQRVNTATGPTTLRVPIGGNYSVNADCTGEDIVINQLNTALFNTQELILIDRGKEFLFVVTTAGGPPIVSGAGRKLSRRESDRDQ